MPTDKQVFDFGREWIKLAKGDPDLPLDNTDKSMESVQTLLETLDENETSPEYVDQALIGLAIYIGDMLRKKFPEFKYIILYGDNGEVDEVQLNNGKAEINLFSWVNKCIVNPERDNVALKYNSVVKMLSKN